MCWNSPLLNNFTLICSDNSEKVITFIKLNTITKLVNISSLLHPVIWASAHYEVFKLNIEKLKPNSTNFCNTSRTISTTSSVIFLKTAINNTCTEHCHYDIRENLSFSTDEMHMSHYTLYKIRMLMTRSTLTP